MKNNKKRVSIILAVSLVITTFSGVLAFADSKAMEATIINDYLATSLQYAVIDDGSIVKSGHSGVYSKTENRALSADTMYGIGSISKMFTTTAMMKLVDQGKVNLDSPVTTYIPEFKMADLRYKDITVRMLLNHSSGLMGSTINNAFLLGASDDSALTTLLSDLESQTLKDNPGAFSVYCNDGFTLAEILIERVSGKSFSEFIRQNIAEPLNMKNTKTPADSFDTNQLAKIYNGKETYALPPENGNIIGTGGVYSTAEDLCKFSQMFMSAQGESSKVLSMNSANAMASPEYKNGIWPDEETGSEGALSYGLGWDNVQGELFLDYNIKELTKGGDTIYYHGALVVLPEKNMAAAVLSSGGASTYDQFLAEELLLEQMNKKESETPLESPKDINLVELAAKPTPVAVTIPKNIMKNEGMYGSTSIMKVSMTAGGILSITDPNVPDYQEVYYHQGNGIFSDRTGLVKVSFVDERNGHTYIHIVGPSILPGLGTVNSNMYTAQKIENNPLSSDILKVWQDRTKHKYFIINEKYNTAVATAGMAVPITLSKPASEGGIDGYAGNTKILDANKSQPVLQIPGMYGRDLQSFDFFKKDGQEFVKITDFLAISEEALSNIYHGKNSTCTIGKDGYSKWYKIGMSAGKNMTVNIPKNAAFNIYDNNGLYFSSSLLTGKNTFTLPVHGYVLFSGNPGSTFKITLN